MHQKKLYKTYGRIKQRCYNKNNKSFKYYGGRGIKCRWKSFEEFYRDMSPGYKTNLTIDRIDVNGDYCKENCKWSTAKEQANNRRTNRIIKFNGKEKNLSEWAECLKISVQTLSFRIKKWGLTDKTFYTLLEDHKFKPNPTSYRSISLKNGWDQNLVGSRIRKGWSFEDATRLEPKK